MPCGRRQLGNGANDNVSLKNDWGAGTETYLSPIAVKTWPQQTGGYKMKFHINNYIWWIDIQANSGKSNFDITQPSAVTGIPAYNLGNTGTAWYFLSDSYSSVTLVGRSLGIYTWRGWYNNSGGLTGGSNVQYTSANTFVLSYSDAAILNGATVWAVAN